MRYDRAAVSRVILARIADGESLKKACEPKDMPNAGTFRDWRREDPALARAYEIASQASAWSFIARMRENMALPPELTGKGFVDQGWVKDMVVRTDNLQWIASRMDRARFGINERLEVGVSADDPHAPLIAFAIGVAPSLESGAGDTSAAGRLPDKALYLGAGEGE